MQGSPSKKATTHTISVSSSRRKYRFDAKRFRASSIVVITTSTEANYNK